VNPIRDFFDAGEHSGNAGILRQQRTSDPTSHDDELTKKVCL